MTIDTRDLRDPKFVGEALLEQAPYVRNAYGAGIPLSEIYDHHVSKFDIPNYPQDESIAVLTAHAYRTELQERVANGDKCAEAMLASIRARTSNDVYAASVLAKIDHGVNYDDDPSGT